MSKISIASYITLIVFVFVVASTVTAIVVDEVKDSRYEKCTTQYVSIEEDILGLVSYLLNDELDRKIQSEFDSVEKECLVKYFKQNEFKN